jgi:hypothetical protein
VQYDGEKPKIGGLSLEIMAGAVGAVIVVMAGKWFARRKEAASAASQPAAERPET